MKHIRLLLIVICAFATASLNAQWTSEGTGRTYTLPELAEIPETGIQYVYDDYYGDFFQINNDWEIVGDTLLLNMDVRLADSVSIEVRNGGFFCEDITIGNVSHSLSESYTIRLIDNTKISLKNCMIQNCGGISLVDVHAEIERVWFSSFSTNYYSSAISMLNSTANFNNCTFAYNQGSAIGSAANGNSSMRIDSCTFVWNVADHANRPQINLGPGGVDTIFITNSTITNKFPWDIENNYNVGGISVANLLGDEQTTNIVISNCEITGNRYGINQQGSNINSLIINNKISYNNLLYDPMNGGSGISIYGTDESCKAKIRGNVINGNMWGITSINKNNIDLGTDDDPGENRIYDNENGGTVYALYNNASTDITAIGNYWGSNDATEAEDVIFHRPDLGNTYGLVTFEPVLEVHPELVSLICRCPYLENDFEEVEVDEIGFINEHQHTVYITYNGVLEELEEYYEDSAHDFILIYELGAACSGTPQSGEIFHFDDLWQSQLVISTPHGETETWTIQIIETESVTEQETEELTITPIPAREKVQINMDADTPYIITDLTGRTVCKGKSVGESIEINVQDWESGIYIIKTQKNGKEKTGRIVVF